jgi:ribosome recycling factor
MKTVIQDHEQQMKKAIAALEHEFAALRTGRATAAMFDKVKVDYYSNATPLSQVANISIPEARLVVIQPWDKAIIGDIEKAIQKSELSLNPSNDGKVIRINIPPLTEDRRKDIVKVAKASAEHARVSIRNIRRDGNEALKKALKNSELSEDDEKKAVDEVQKLTDRYVADINKLYEAKEKEILEV